jgi:glyoxylase-like metal-dependent hydrolase (beta-lactamase superfamily II)
MTDVVDAPGIRISRLELGPYGTNSYIVVCKATGDSLLVDAPDEGEKILSALQGTKPRYIVITHNHFDHTQALQEVKSNLGIPIAAHRLDAGGLPCPADIEMKDGGVITIGQLSLTVIHTPGHTAGSICLYTGKYLLAGDTIFPGGPGHTASPADLAAIIQSINTKIVILPDDTVIYPGHGDFAILANEKKSIAAFNSRPHPPDLHGDVLWLSA